MNILQYERNIEDIELALTEFNARRALSPVDKKLEIKRIGSTALLIDTASPTSMYYNRIKGFGKEDIDRLDDILDIYRTERIVPCVDMAPSRLNEDVARALAAKGFINTEQLAFLRAGPCHNEERNLRLRIEPVTSENAEFFIGLIGLPKGGMDLSEDLIQKKKEYFYRPDFQNYVAYVGEEAAGMGSLFISGNAGYIANDFTFPPFRGKGCQSALVRHRLQVADKMGLANVYTDVEFGTISHNNMLRAGFQTMLLNSFWMRSGN